MKVNKIISSSKLLDTPYCPTISDCYRWTEILNQIIFGGKVAKYRKIIVRRLHNQWAYCHYGKSPVRQIKQCDLVIHNRFPSFSAFYSILAHELIHLCEYYETEQIAHGKFFYSHREMLANIGIRLTTSYSKH